MCVSAHPVGVIYGIVPVGVSAVPTCMRRNSTDRVRRCGPDRVMVFLARMFWERVVRNMMPPLECSFRTISSIAKLPCGRFCSVCHALQVGLALIGNDLAAFSANNPTGTSSNTDRVSRHTLTFCPDRYYFPTHNTGRDYFCHLFQA